MQGYVIFKFYIMYTIIGYKLKPGANNSQRQNC